VSRDGTIGFYPAEATETDTRVTAWPTHLLDGPEDAPVPADPPATALTLMRGTRILRVNDAPVTSFESIADALVGATQAAHQTGAASATVALAMELPVKQDGRPAIETVEWTLPKSAIDGLHGLGWRSPISTGVFEREEIVLQASDPIQAVVMGLNRTHRVMMQTYLTFSRLFQGSVKVEHLKGPVGIAHIGTMVASRGYVHLLFFMALISVNLGVVNFLPIPIADGGHFLFLVYEQVTGKPVSVAVQNIATLAGLILIVGMFLLVTYNDIANLFG
jgi:regulator of sigma E protease